MRATFALCLALLFALSVRAQDAPAKAEPLPVPALKPEHDVVIAENKKLSELVSALRNKDDSLHGRASSYLCASNEAIWNAAYHVVPALADTLSDKQIDRYGRQFAAESLAGFGRLGAPAVPVLIRVLGDDKEAVEVRSAAAGALASLTPWSKEAVPVLAATLRATEFEDGALVGKRQLALNCLMALQMLAPFAGAEWSALVQLLDHADYGAAVSASETLARLKLDDKALEAMRKLAADADKSLRRRAGCGALMANDDGTARDWTLVLSCLRQAGGDEIQLSAAFLRAAGKEKLAALVAMAEGNERNAARAAIAALALLGQEYANVLRKALRAEDEEIRFAAAQTMLRLGLLIADDAPALTAMLDAGEPYYRSPAVEGLAVLKIESAIPRMIEFLKAKDRDAPYRALQFFGLWQGRHEGAAAALLEFAAVHKPRNGDVWATALAFKLSPDAGKMSAYFAELVKREGVEDLPFSFCETLGPAAAPLMETAATYFTKLYENTPVYLRQALARTFADAVRAVGPDSAKAVLPVLLMLLQGPHQVPHLACRALTSLGGQGAPAAPELRKICADALKKNPLSGHEVRRECAAALAVLAGDTALAAPIIEHTLECWADPPFPACVADVLYCVETAGKACLTPAGAQRLRDIATYHYDAKLRARAARLVENFK